MSPSTSSPTSTALSNGKSPPDNIAKQKGPNVARMKKSSLKHKQNPFTHPTMQIRETMTKNLSTNSILRAKLLKEAS